MIDFAFDHLYNPSKGYPNLSIHRPRPYTPEWRQFDQHWPNVVPLRLLMYLDDAAVPYRVWSVTDAPQGSIYAIAFSWFDFSMDYVSLVPEISKGLIRKGALKLIFYYHEGDHPGRIRSRLDDLCMIHGIDHKQTLLISSNSAAREIDNCVYFDDFECWLWSLNRSQTSMINKKCPPKDFTVLSRTNKSWRACVMHDLFSKNLLHNSLWSYASDLPMIDDPADNPLEYAAEWHHVNDFLGKGPYTCDGFDTVEQNDHHQVNDQLYLQSKFQLVLETHLDADGSGGCFITEKTYKCIKFGQPFLVIGTPGTLAMLKEHGYRVFDHVIDNRYDQEPDNTRRWHMLLDEIMRLKSRMESAWHACISDREHNARLFSQRPYIAVNNLMQEITCHQ